MEKTALTRMEKIVIKAIKENDEGGQAYYDNLVSDEVPAMKLKGVVGSLVKKGLVRVDPDGYFIYFDREILDQL